MFFVCGIEHKNARVTEAGEMEDLLKRFVDGTLGRDELRLYQQHRAHFRRRVQPLDPSFFPGNEKSDEAARSLANGAYASFAKEPKYDGEPAFFHAVRKHHQSITGFLYYWRDSATIRFLRNEGSELLCARAKIQRNIRLHLKSTFRPLGARSGQTLWALPEWPDERLRERPPNLENIEARPRAHGIKELIRAVLEAAGTPLTRAEIAAVVERVFGFAREVQLDHELHPEHHEQHPALATTALRRRIEAFWASLDDEARELLWVRGYSEKGVATVSFREVAEKLGRRSGETYRLMERRIFERLRKSFDADEMREAVPFLVNWISSLEDA